MIDIYDNEKFKYVNENRLVEIDYDHSEYKNDILSYFEENIRNEKYGGWHGGTNPDGTKEGAETYHIDYGPIDHMKDWIWLCNKFEALMKDMGNHLDFNEFKHTLKFTFIKMDKQSNLIPHTASFIRAAASVNLPLMGVTKIDLYEDGKNPRKPGNMIDTHHYTSPILLNVNQFHGVRNFIDEDRMILKVHLPVVSYPMLVESFRNPVKVLRFDPPWGNGRGTRQII